MIFTNLQESPDHYQNTIKLIEESFGYKEDYHFDIDFYPLMQKENWDNCHIIKYQDQVVAHIGVFLKEIQINHKTYPICLYGGIAVSDRYRGQGLFKKLFAMVLQKYESCAALHLLWSDQLELYKRFCFYPAIEQFQLSQDLSDATEYIPTQFSQLSSEQKQQIKNLYNKATKIHLKRNQKDWEDIEKITSATLYIKENKNQIINYFFMNKGQDLTQIIYESGDYSDYKEMRKFGLVWSPISLEQSEEILFASVVKIGEPKLFSQFIADYTKHKITVNNISEKEVSFLFEQNSLNLDHQDFLTGILGPNRFEELGALDSIFISGLDSI